MKAHVRNDVGEKVKLIWDLLLLIALNEELGLGNKRLKRVYEKMLEVQNNFDKNSTCTDGRGKTVLYNDIETGLAMVTRNADRHGIDWRDVLGVDII